MRTLKVLGFLLGYPTAMHQEVAQECADILRQEKGLADKALKDIEVLLGWIKDRDLLDMQEDYVDLFDRTPSLSLHLFEHVHGDARERGQALADLMERYQEKGFTIATAEMPDFLPLFLEFISTLENEAMQEYLGSAVTILAAIEERLKKRASPYAAVFEALLGIAARKPDMKQVDDVLRKASGAPLDEVQLDKEWEEQFAFDPAGVTGGAASCPKASAMLARMDEQAEKQKVRS